MQDLRFKSPIASDSIRTVASYIFHGTTDKAQIRQKLPPYLSKDKRISGEISPVITQRCELLHHWSGESNTKYTNTTQTQNTNTKNQVKHCHRHAPPSPSPLCSCPCPGPPSFSSSLSSSSWSFSFSQIWYQLSGNFMLWWFLGKF